MLFFFLSSYVFNYCIILAIVDLCFSFYPSPIIDQKFALKNLKYIYIYMALRCYVQDDIFHIKGPYMFYNCIV